MIFTMLSSAAVNIHISGYEAVTKLTSLVMENVTRESVLQLISMKDELEDQLKSLSEVLAKNNVGMDEPLVDAEGFPRSDIDVYQVRLCRHKIICLRNDLKDLTGRIERSLHSLHEQQREGLGPVKCSQTEDLPSVPFARIGAVTEGSPADRAGLKCDDLIVSFGTLNTSNFTGLQDMASILQHSVDRQIPLKVSRSGKQHSLELTPRTWSGRGLLGCTLLPHDNVDR